MNNSKIENPYEVSNLDAEFLAWLKQKERHYKDKAQKYVRTDVRSYNENVERSWLLREVYEKFLLLKDNQIDKMGEHYGEK